MNPLNPYTDNQPRVHTTESLFKDYKPPKTKRRSERGDLLEYFSQKLEKPIGYVAFRCKGMELVDLFYIKSACDDYQRRGNPWAKGWYGMLK